MLINFLIFFISQWRRKWKSDRESVSGTGSPPKVNQFFQLVGPIITPSFNKLADYFCSNPPHRQTDRMTDRQTDRPDCITSTLVEVTLVLPANRMEIITSSKQNSNRVKHKTTNEIFLSWSSSVAWIYRVFMFWCRPAHNYWHLAVLSTWMYKLMSHMWPPL